MVRPICDDVRTRGVEAIVEYSERFDGVEHDDIAVPRGGAAATPSTSSTPPSAPRSRSRSAGCGRPARPSSSSDVDHRRRPRRAGSPSAWSRSTGSASTCPAASPRWSPACVMNVVPAQVAGVGVDRARLARRRRTTAGCRTRRSWRPARCSASTRSTPSAAPRRSRCSPTAPARAAPVDLVTGPGNIYVVAAKRLLKGVVGIDSEAGPDRDRDPRRRHRRPGVRRRRPDQPGRARPAGRRACWSPTRERLADEVEAELDKQVAATRHTERIRTALAGQQSGDRAGRRPRAGPRGRRRLRRRAPRDPDRATPRAVAARVRNAGAIFVGPCAPVRSATTAPAPTTCCPPAAAPATPRACRCGRSCRSVHVVDYSRDALAEVADHVVDARRGRGPARPRRGRHGAVPD